MSIHDLEFLKEKVNKLKEDGVYYVAFPDLPHIFTFGYTKKEALYQQRPLKLFSQFYLH